MKTHWRFHDCDQYKDQARDYWEKKARRLERLLSNYHPEFRRLSLVLYEHPSRNQFELRAVLHLPTGTLIAEETRPSVREAIDTIADELARQIRRHKSQVRKDYVYRRRRERRRNLSAAGPYLEHDAKTLRKEAFFALLRPHLDHVYEYARRELAIMEGEDILPKGQWTPADLVDDVLIRAWEEFSDRPQREALDVWLIELLHQRLDEWSKGDREFSLAGLDELIRESDAEEKDLDPDDLEFWWKHVAEPVDPLSWEDLLPDEEWSSAWEELSAEEQEQRLIRHLSNLPATLRHAILLHDAYGFELSEVARIVDRSESQVRADLEEARDQLRRSLAHEEFRN